MAYTENQKVRSFVADMRRRYGWNNKIDQIRALRQEFGFPLKLAKNIIDAYYTMPGDEPWNEAIETALNSPDRLVKLDMSEVASASDEPWNEAIETALNSPDRLVKLDMSEVASASDEHLVLVYHWVNGDLISVPPHKTKTLEEANQLKAYLWKNFPVTSVIVAKEVK